MNVHIKPWFALIAFILFVDYQPAKAAIIDPIAPMDHQTYLKEIRWHGWEANRRFETYRHDD